MTEQSTILTLTGQIATALAREPLESERLKTLTGIVRVLRESMENGGVREQLDWLLTDLSRMIDRAVLDEAEEQAEHERISRTSARYRRDFSEGTL